MKQKGNCLTGDPVILYNYTSRWPCVYVHPLVFYRRLDKFQEGFKKVKGIYVEIDIGDQICIRFSDKADLTAFHKMHHEYV